MSKRLGAEFVGTFSLVLGGEEAPTAQVLFRALWWSRCRMPRWLN